MVGFLNACIYRAASSGLGDFVVSAAITGFMTPAQADAVDQVVYRYRAESDDKSQWEIGYGVYTVSSTTQARTLIVKSSNANAKVNFTAAPRVYITEIADDLLSTPRASLSFNLASKFWGNGTALAPTSWTLTGASATVAKNTTSGQFRSANAGAALTRVGTDCKLTQNVAAITDWSNLAAWSGKKVTFGRWVYATVASRVRIAIWDGTTRTFSQYHTGGSGLEFLTVTATLASPPTEVTLECHVDTGNTTGVFSGGAFIVGESMNPVVAAPQEWQGAKSMVIFTTAGLNLSPGFSSMLVGINPVGAQVGLNGVFYNMYMQYATPPGSTQTVTWTNRRNNGTGAITCTVSGTSTMGSSATFGTDLVNQAYYAAGDIFDLLVSISSAAVGGQAAGSMVYEEVPLA